jgi:hypothetical protein
MFTALSGRQVHEAETHNEQMLCAMAQPVRSLAFVAPDLPRLLVDFVDRTLAYEPDRRWPNATAMQAALREVHAALIEQQMLPEADGDPQVSLGEFTSGIASESPVTISAELRFARPSRRDAKTLVARRSSRRGALWFAIGSTLLLMNASVWIRWQRQLASTPIVMESQRPTSPAGTGMFPAWTERYDLEGTATSVPTEMPRSVPVRIKGPRHGGARSAPGPVPQSLPASNTSSPSPEPKTTAIDPLERRR